MCRLHLFPRARLDEHQLMIDAVRFGKGLQLVNILRDLPADLRQGRCYLPSEPLAGCGLTPQDLLDPANEPRLRPFYQSLVTVAEKHLLAGWDYTQSLPRHCVRVRLACAWPLLIGRETLQLLRTNNVLDPARRLKISRKQVKSIIARSVLLYPVPSVWRGLYRPSLPGEAQPRTSIP
jgi:farnesyl-diphosphate farnesyltransferase